MCESVAIVHPVVAIRPNVSARPHFAGRVAPPCARKQVRFMSPDYDSVYIQYAGYSPALGCIAQACLVMEALRMFS